MGINVNQLERVLTDGTKVVSKVLNRCGLKQTLVSVYDSQGAFQYGMVKVKDAKQVGDKLVRRTERLVTLDERIGTEGLHSIEKLFNGIKNKFIDHRIFDTVYSKEGKLLGKREILDGLDGHKLVFKRANSGKFSVTEFKNGIRDWRETCYLGDFASGISYDRSGLPKNIFV